MAYLRFIPSATSFSPSANGSHTPLRSSSNSSSISLVHNARRRQLYQVVVLSLVLSIFFCYVFLQLFGVGASFAAGVGASSRTGAGAGGMFRPPYGTARVDAGPDADVERKRASFSSWVDHLRSVEGGIFTRRTLCHELDNKAQTCVFEGVMCMNVSSPEDRGKPRVWVIDDSKAVQSEAPTDNWCGYRYRAADPVFYSTRHWPIADGTFAPQHSCLEMLYTNLSALQLPSAKRIAWLPSLAVFDFDFFSNDHNGHFASDTLWFLDALLFQKSLDRPLSRPGYRATRPLHDSDTLLLREDVRLYFPNARHQFEEMMHRDQNRLLLASLLQLDLRRLYKNLSDDQLLHLPDIRTQRRTERLFDAYPHLHGAKPAARKFEFHGDYVRDERYDFVCTPRLTAGFKTGFSVAERVCRDIRTRSYELFGIKRPEVVDVGQIKFPQPPNNILILDRHITRTIGNKEELVRELTEFVRPLNVSVTVMDTGIIDTAEQWVRLYSQYGIIITPHGSQNIGQLWMQRYSALIEIMPVGYTEYSFYLLSKPCKIWFYEFQSSSIAAHQQKYEHHCGDRKPHMFKPCTEYKSESVWVNITKMKAVVLNALERLGYHTGAIWFGDLYDMDKQEDATKATREVSEANSAKEVKETNPTSRVNETNATSGLNETNATNAINVENTTNATNSTEVTT